MSAGTAGLQLWLLGVLLRDHLCGERRHRLAPIANRHDTSPLGQRVDQKPRRQCAPTARVLDGKLTKLLPQRIRKRHSLTSSLSFSFLSPSSHPRGADRVKGVFAPVVNYRSSPAGRNRISHSNSTPKRERTVSRICATRRRTSCDVAPPQLTIKPACFTDTCAPPTV